jgi:4-hydroxy-3-methylbut-2-enyl diphosphate reductase
MANAKHYNANNLFEAFRLSEQLKSVVRYKNAADDIEKEWFKETDSVGICGATSTPRWLMEKVALHINELFD